MITLALTAIGIAAHARAVAMPRKRRTALISSYSLEVLYRRISRLAGPAQSSPEVSIVKTRRYRASSSHPAVSLPHGGGGNGAGKMPRPAGVTWREPGPGEARGLNNRKSSCARARGVYAHAKVRRHCWAGRSSRFPPVRSRRPDPRDRSCLPICHVPPHRHSSHPPRRRQRLCQGR